MDILFYFFVFIFGALIGSFLNVVILRYNTGITILGRSFCFSCRHQLTWKELFPVFSFLALKGKCRECGSKISRQYIVVEALTGLLFMLIFWKLGGTATFFESLSTSNFCYPIEVVFFGMIFSLLVVMGAYDVRHKILPDLFVYAFAFLSLLRVLFLPATFSVSPTMWDLLAGPILALPFALLWLVSKGRWIGLGDAKLMLGIGWFLGLVGGFAVVVLSFWVGALVGILLIVWSKIIQTRIFSRKITMKSELPFAPFLILSFCFVTFFPWLGSAVWKLFFS